MYSWEGYGFWGLVASLIGSALSVWFAVKASLAAKEASKEATNAKDAANVAARETSQTLAIFEVFSELERLTTALESLRSSIVAGDFSTSADKCSFCYKIASRIAASNLVREDTEAVSNIKEVVDQMKKIERDCLDHSSLSPNDIIDMQSIITSLVGLASSMSISIREKDDRVN